MKSNCIVYTSKKPHSNQWWLPILTVGLYCWLQALNKITEIRNNFMTICYSIWTILLTCQYIIPVIVLNTSHWVSISLCLHVLKHICCLTWALAILCFSCSYTITLVLAVNVDIFSSSSLTHYTKSLHFNGAKDGNITHKCSLWLFNQHLRQHWISCTTANGHVLLHWLPLSPDLIPCNFSHGVTLRTRLLQPSLPWGLPELQRWIIAAISQINHDMPHQVWAELDYRLDVCQLDFVHVTKDGHKEHLLLCKIKLESFSF